MAGTNAHDLVFKCDAVTDRQSISSSKLSLWFKLIKKDHVRASYLSSISPHNLRIAIKSLQFQTIRTVMLLSKTN